MEKPSRNTPLNTDAAWESLIQANQTIQLLGRLSDAQARRSSEAVDTLKTVQPSARVKRYKEFLSDALRIGPEIVLLCAAALGQVKAADMKYSDRVALISKIKDNKDDVNFKHPTVQSLAIKYKITQCVAELPPSVPVVTEGARKRKRTVTESANEEPANDYGLTPNITPAVISKSATGLTGDAYALAAEDASAIIAEIRGQIWLTDPYDANTHQPFVTIPISWKLRDHFIVQRRRII